MNKKILPEPAPLKKWAGTYTLVWFWGEANLQPMADGGGAKTSITVDTTTGAGITHFTFTKQSMYLWTKPSSGKSLLPVAPCLK